MDYYRKIERSVTISADKRSTVDLQVDVWSADANITKFILKLDTADSTPIDLTDATVTTALVYDGVILQDNGQVEEVATQRISYVLNERLRGYEGVVNGGFYVTLKTGQKIDIQNVSFNMCKSLIDTDLEPARENAYATFDTITDDVKDYADTQKSAMLAKTNEVTSYGDTQKTAMNNIVKDVQSTGNTAKTQIGQVLPDVQSKVSAINNELAKIDENMPDLFVAYADDSQGSEFSKTDTTKLYKGFGVKNSNLPADYRWERNVDGLQVGGTNLLLGTREFKSVNIGNGSGMLIVNSYPVISEQYNGLSVRGSDNVVGTNYMSEYEIKGFELGETFTLSFWAKGTINVFRCYFHGDRGCVGAKPIKWSLPSIQHSVAYSDGHVAFVNPPISNWTRVSVTWQLADTGDTNIRKKVLIRTDGATGGSLYICGEKFERGNMPTSWSPAPEDIQTQIDTTNSRLDGLSVGGENLFLDAAFRNKFLNITANTSYVPGHWIAYNNHSSYKFGEYNGKTNYLQFTSTSKITLGIIQFLDRVVLQPGKEYCIRLFTMCETSDYAIGIKINKKSSNGSIDWNYSTIFNKTVKASSNYSEISAKFTIPAEDDGVMYGISIFNYGTDTSNGQTIKIVKPKLEEGNLFTDFSVSTLDDNVLGSHPINSVLTTLSSENPSTTLGGTWTQFGTESKFGSTIYYWKRTN